MVSCCWGNWLVPDDPSLASKSRFLGRWPFNAYKFIMALYAVFWCVYWPVVERINDGFKLVTHWTFYVSAIYFVVSTITAFGAIGKSASPKKMFDQDGPTLSALGRFVMWLQIFTWNVGCLASLVVVVIYWGVLHEKGDPLDSVEINAHVLIAIFMLVDQFLIATEYQMKQLWASELFGAVYIAFNIAFYYSNGHDDIYAMWDWGKDPSTAIAYSAAVLLVLLPSFAVMHLGVFRLREYIFMSQRAGASPKHPGDGTWSASHQFTVDA